MNAPSHPDPKQLEQVETSLYNRMLKNAFAGFVKSAAIAAGIGFVLGGLIASGVGAGVLPSALGTLVGTGGTFLSGAVKLATLFAGLAGGFGAVAGIQSTRDTRRFFQIHEAPETSVTDSKGRTVISHGISYASPEEQDPPGDHFHTKKLREATPAERGR